MISAGCEQDGVPNLWAFGYGTHFLWGNGFRLNFAYYDGEGHPYSDFNSNEIYIQENTWYHIAVVRSGTELMFYFNGSYVGTAAIGNVSLGGGNTGLLIGARYETDPSDIIEFAQGLIDEVEIFNRALSHNEIIQIYKAGAEGKCRPCATPPSGMVSWWKAENNAEDSIGINNGTLINGATFTTGMVGQAFSFDGWDDYVTVPDSPSLDVTTQFTLDAWVYPKGDLGGYPEDAIISKVGGLGGNNGYQLGLTPDGANWKVYCIFNADGEGWPANIVVGGTVINNAWHHITCSYDNNDLKIYVNGIIAGTKDVGAKSVVNSSSTLRISGDDNNHAYFHGYIDEAEVFNRALTDEEIQGIYNARSAGKCLYFPLQISKTGNGGGTISSNPSGINCGTTCWNDFRVYFDVILTAQEETNSYFSGWGGNCSSCGTNLQCNVFMDSSKSCTASFLLRPPSEASGGSNLMHVSKGTGTSIDITFTPSNCAQDHTIYWGQSPISGNLNWIDAECGYGNAISISFDPGDPPEGSFYYFVLVGNNGYEEGSYGKNSSGMERSEATGISGCDWTQNLNNNCQ